VNVEVSVIDEVVRIIDWRDATFSDI
jgi:hypothetical protein